MQQLIPRTKLSATVTAYLAEAPVVAVLGARQVGKTTLAKGVASEWSGPSHHLDLEVAAHLQALTATPERVLARSEGLVVIDEVQRLPRIFADLRPICDSPECRAVFLLLGSASPELVRGVSESLAGRVLFVDMGGLSLDEVGPTHQDELWFRGGYARAYLAPSINAWERWIQSYTRTFIERDIPAISPNVSSVAVGRFWRMLAHVHAQTWNAAALARSMDASTRTVHRYRDLLEGSFTIRVLRPWFENLGKRLVKSPKVYIRDSGMLHFLLGVRDMNELAFHPRYGASWEGFALEQTLLAQGQDEAYFYATQRGAELDLLLLRRGRRWGFEFKCNDAPRTSKSMHVVIEDLGLEHLWAVYPGDLEYSLADRITALPLAKVGGLDLGRPHESN